MTNKNILDIQDKKADYDSINEKIKRTEIGFRAICVMYDDHSSDRKSRENIYTLKDNILYRLDSISYQYHLFLKELYFAKDYLSKISKQDKYTFILDDKGEFKEYFLDNIEKRIAFVFDNIIFQIASYFDYFSHYIFYICRENKNKTDYWSKLVYSMNDKSNALGKLEISNNIKDIDNRFVGNLFDYRARLIHNKRDEHRIYAENFEIGSEIIIFASESSIKLIKSIKKEYPDKDFTLTFLISNLINQTILITEEILGALRIEILKDSHFEENFKNPKNNSFSRIGMDPITKEIKPCSEFIWIEYKKQIK